MRKFTYNFSWSNEKKTIQVDINKIPTIDHLRKVISKELFIDNTKLTIINYPTTKNLKEFKDQQNFTISIKNDYPNITFYFPNNMKMKIDNCYKMQIYDICQCFHSNNIYYSKECMKKNLRFEISKQLLPENAEYPFLSPTSDTAYIKMINDFVFLKYDNCRFILSEKESANHLYDILHKIYGGETTIYIYKKRKLMKPSKKLKKSKEYKIVVEKPFIFTKIYSLLPIEISDKCKFDLMKTVYDVKVQLACINLFAKVPEDVILYTKNMTKINDQNLKLSKLLKNGQQFFYKIKSNGDKNDDQKCVKKHRKKHQKKQKDGKQDIWHVTFYFNCRSESNVQKETIQIFNRIKIGKLKDILKSWYQIGSDIQIKLKNGTVVDDNQRIIDISKQIRTDKKNELFIYEVANQHQNQNHQQQKDKNQQQQNKQEKQDKNQQQQNKQEKQDKNQKQQNKLEKQDKDQQQQNKKLQQSDNKKPIKRIESSGKVKIDDDGDDDKKVKKQPSRQKSGRMIRYIYQTNIDSDDCEIELDENATVKNLKEKIGKAKGISNLANIKIIFAGKDLLNDIVLDELNIGDIKLFVYIRKQEDILLLTAKALQHDEYSSSDDSIIIEEEEEDKDDNDKK